MLKKLTLCRILLVANGLIDIYIGLFWIPTRVSDVIPLQHNSLKQFEDRKKSSFQIQAWSLPFFFFLLVWNVIKHFYMDPCIEISSEKQIFSPIKLFLFEWTTSLLMLHVFQQTIIDYRWCVEKDLSCVHVKRDMFYLAILQAIRRSIFILVDDRYFL